MELRYYFYIKVEANGSQEPLISIQPESYNMLTHIGFGHMDSSSGVRNELSEINLVLSESKEKHSFGGDDWCLLDVKKETTIITNGFDEFEPVEIDTDQIVKLMEDWLQFLLDYENNKIPGLTYPENK